MDKNPQQMWLENLQRQHHHPQMAAASSRSGAGGGGAPMSNLPRSAVPHAAFLSTPQYVRQAAAAAANPHLAPPVSNGYPTGRSAKTTRGGGGGGSSSSPHMMVKDREALGEEIIELKKKIVRLTEEANVGKAKNRRLEEDNKNKDRQLEALLDPSRSEEVRRTLGEKKSDSASVIGSLKQRIFKLEQSLKDKEAALTALQKDHKATNVHELKVQMETMYQEILRLRKVNQVIQASATARAAFAEEAATPSTKVKALNNAILRLHSENQDMGKESLSLKTDLEAALSENENLKDQLQKERQRNSAPSASAVAATAAETQHRFEAENFKKEVTRLQEELAKINERNNNNNDKKKSRKKDSDSEESEDGGGGSSSKARLKNLEKALDKFKKRRADASSTASTTDVDANKIGLTGGWMDCLDALDVREAELLEEVEKSKSLSKKLKEEKGGLKKKASEAGSKAEKEAEKAEEAERKADEWKVKCERLEAELETALANKSKSPRTPRDRRSSGQAAPSSRTNTPPARTASPNSARESTPTSARRGRAASSSPLPPVGGARKQQSQRLQDDEEEKRMRRDEERKEKERGEEEEEAEERRRRRRKSREEKKRRKEEEDNAASAIQRKWKNHRRHKKEEEERRRKAEEEEEEKARMELADVTRVQSALRGHLSRANTQAERTNSFRDEDEDAALTLQNAVRGHAARLKAGVRREPEGGPTPPSASRRRTATSTSRSRSPPTPRQQRQQQQQRGKSPTRQSPPTPRQQQQQQQPPTQPKQSRPSAGPSSRSGTPRDGRSDSAATASRRPERKNAVTPPPPSRRNEPDDESTDDDADVMF